MTKLSTKAASLVDTVRTGVQKTQQQRVLHCLMSQYPTAACRDTLADYLDMRVSSVCARLNELVELGVVRVMDRVWAADTKRLVYSYAAVYNG